MWRGNLDLEAPIPLTFSGICATKSLSAFETSTLSEVEMSQKVSSTDHILKPLKLNGVKRQDKPPTLSRFECCNVVHKVLYPEVFQKLCALCPFKVVHYAKNTLYHSPKI